MDDDNNGYIDDIYGWNFLDNNNDPNDDYGHGTHVAGTIGAKGISLGVAGTVWSGKLMALKFLNRQEGSTSDAIQALNMPPEWGKDFQ